MKKMAVYKMLVYDMTIDEVSVKNVLVFIFMLVNLNKVLSSNFHFVYV